MTKNTENTNGNARIDDLFKAGAHFGFIKSRRHPTVSSYIFGVKNHVEIFDLEKTGSLLAETLEYVKKLGAEKKTVLFVGGKSEAKKAIKKAGEALNMPYVAGRWVGGTISNFTEIRKRIEKLLDLTSKREKGELGKYTKKERLLIDREITRLETLFSGLVSLTKTPDVLFIIDSKKESIALAEAKAMNIPVVALCGSDCNIKEVDHPIVGNDATLSSINYIVDQVITAYKDGAK
jgi:small subunit ribosomal protein S2